MNQSMFESMSRVLLALAVAALAGALAVGGTHEAIAQTRTAQCDSYSNKKNLTETLNSMLGNGRTDFIVTVGGTVCGW